MNAQADARSTRLREVVGAVARQALLDRGMARVAVLDDGSPEAELATRWLMEEIGEKRVALASVVEEEVESVLHALSAQMPHLQPDPHEPAERRRRLSVEVCRLRARLDVDALMANPSNKTVLLLGGAPPPEPFFPLGDLYATEVRELAGGWSAPPTVEALADRCGGIDHLDAALRGHFDRREPDALQALPADAARAVTDALARGRAARVFGMLVPKLGSRTLGVDLFE
jgi:hypothetical protein